MVRRLTYSLALLIIFFVVITSGNELFNSPESPNYDTTAVEKKFISPYIKISNFDKHFRKAADSLRWDWKFIAAIAFTESRFDSMAQSGVGARGVMQVMPRTLRQQGVPDSLDLVPEYNIKAAAGLLGELNRIFRRIENFEERSNFILASYNAGIGEVSDAMRLAEKYGRNRYVWENSVDTFLMLKSKPEYYNDSVCKNGSFYDWKQTFQFIAKVKRTWNKYIDLQEAYNDSIYQILLNDSTIEIKRE